MKILQVCSAREIGGGERHLVDLANSLVARGHEVYAGVIPGSPLPAELTSLPDNHIVELRLRNSLDLLSAIRLARFASEQGIEIIHAHVARDYPLVAFASSRAGDTPYVLTRHVLFPLKSVHSLLLRRVSRVIAVSQAVADGLKEQNLFDIDKIVMIHNGIDITRFTMQPRGRNRPDCLSGIDAPLLVGMVGHLAPIKGQEDFIRAASIVASERNDVDFVIACEDKSNNRGNRAGLERLIAELGLEKRVHMIGWLDDVRDFLRELDLFVSPSRSEPFGLAIVEAMASGVPVIASMSEGALEIIEDGVSGRLVPVGDAKQLAATISELLASESELQRLSGNALDLVQRRFSLESMVEATEQLYSKVLSERRS